MWAFETASKKRSFGSVCHSDVHFAGATFSCFDGKRRSREPRKKRIDACCAVWQMNYPDLKATHTFGDDKKIVPVTREFAPAGNKTFTYTFPAHSLTILTLHLQ